MAVVTHAARCERCQNQGEVNTQGAWPLQFFGSPAARLAVLGPCLRPFIACPLPSAGWSFSLRVRYPYPPPLAPEILNSWT